MKRYLILGSIAIFVMGWYVGTEMTETELSPVIRLKDKQGKMLAFAYTNPELAQIVNLEKGQSPGAYVAFPLFSEHSKIEGLLN